MHRKAAGATRDDLQGFRQNLRVLEREIVRQLESETSCCGVTLTQCHVLLELSASGPLSLTGLVAALDLDKSTLSRVVDGLVKAGWVERTPDPTDRRAVRVACTPAGRARVAAVDDACNRYYESLLDRMSRLERRHVIGAVRALAEGMQESRRSADGPTCGTRRPVASARTGGAR